MSDSELFIGFRYFTDNGEYVEVISIDNGTHEYKILERETDFQYDSIKRDVPQLTFEKPSTDYPKEAIDKMSGY